MEATAPSGVGGSKAASARKAGPAAGADDRDISDDVPLFAFDASNTETLSRSGGRPKRKLKAIARFESMSWRRSSVHCKVGEGFSCPECAATCSYDVKECTECHLSCYYEAGMGVVVLKERKIDQSRQHLVQKRAPRRKRLQAKASPKIAVGEVGYTFLKKFDDGWYEGRVVKVRPGAREGKDRRCVYSDGDSEDLSMEQLRALLLLERNRPKSVDDKFIEPEVVEVPHFSSERTTRSQVPTLPKNEPEDILNGHVNCPECFRGTLWRKGCKTVHCQNSHLHKCGGWVYFCFFCKERCERGTDFVNCECQWRNTSENRKEVYAQRRLPIDLCRLGDDGEATRVSDSSEGAPNPSPEADALPEDLDEEASHQQVSHDRSDGVGRELADEEDGSFSVDVGDERKLPPRKVIVKREEAETDEESFHQFNAPSKPIEVKTEDAGVKEEDTDTESSNSKGASGEHRPVGAGEKTRSAAQKKPAQKKSRVGGGETTAKNSTPHARPRRDVTNDRKWTEYFELLRAYDGEHGHCNVPQKYAQNPQLGTWVNNQRQRYKKGKLLGERKLLLEGIGFQWVGGTGKDQFYDEQWNKQFELLEAYEAEHGHCNVPIKHAELGKWVQRQRKEKKRDKLSQAHIKRLEEVGFQWVVGSGKNQFNNDVQWNKRYEQLRAYKVKHGHCTKNHKEDGFGLGNWVIKQRQLYKNDKLSNKRKRRLDEIGFCWSPPRGGAWRSWRQARPSQEEEVHK